MADSSMSLVLGFIGNEPVHRDNARALLADLIAAYKRDNKSAMVRFILPTSPFGETIADLADYCLTSGYQIGFVGKAESFDSEHIAPFKQEASGNLYPLNDGISMAKGMVSALSVWAPNARLILIADPNEDDATYIASATAAGMGIRVRSLLDGLDEVLMEATEEEQTKMRLVDEDEEFEETEEDEIEPDEEDLDDEETDETDYSALGVAADGGDEDAQVQLAEEARAADLNPDEYATWVEVADLLAGSLEDAAAEEDDEPEPGAEDEDGFFDVDADPEEDDEEDEEELEAEADEEVVDEEEPEEEPEPEDDEDVEDLDVSDESDDEEEPDEEENEEPVVAKKSAAVKKGAAPKMTEASLIKMGERDKEAFYELAAEYGVYPGRGQKVPIMARKIMEAADGTTPAKKRAPAKKAAAKKAPAAARKAPAKKSAAAKKAPAKRTPAATRAPARATASSNGHVDKATAKKLLKLGQEAVALAESLL